MLIRTRIGCLGVLLGSVSFAESAVAQYSEANCCKPSTARASAAPADIEDEEDTEEDTQSPVGPFVAPAPTMFSTPAPTGEITGSRSGLGLPGLRITLPKISIETPELNLLGFSRSRRDPQMHIDAATAAASSQNPLLFGQIPSNLHQGQPAPASVAPSKGDPPSAGKAPANDGCAEEGCTTAERKQMLFLAQQVELLQRQLAAEQGQSQGRVRAVPAASEKEIWRDARQQELADAEQQVTELTEQLVQLQSAVEQLAKLQQSKAIAEEEARPRARKVTPWQESEEREDLSQSIIDEQSKRIAALEAKLAELSAQTDRAHSGAPGSSVQDPASVPQKAKKSSSSPARSMLSRVGVAFNRK